MINYFRFVRNMAVFAASLLTLILLLSYAVEAHNMKAMGRIQGPADWAYLYGMNRKDPELTVINCCLLGGNGDCQLFPEEGVQYVNGGYLLKDGEFIPEREATVSPDENFYRCQHAGQVSHCFFAPAKGF
jgi:hypothetical protein